MLGCLPACFFLCKDMPVCLPVAVMTSRPVFFCVLFCWGLVCVCCGVLCLLPVCPWSLLLGVRVVSFCLRCVSCRLMSLDCVSLGFGVLSFLCLCFAGWCVPGNRWGGCRVVLFVCVMCCRVCVVGGVGVFLFVSLCCLHAARRFVVAVSVVALRDGVSRFGVLVCFLFRNVFEMFDRGRGGAVVSFCVWVCFVSRRGDANGFVFIVCIATMGFTDDVNDVGWAAAGVGRRVFWARRLGWLGRGGAAARGTPATGDPKNSLCTALQRPPHSLYASISRGGARRSPGILAGYTGRFF